MTEINADTWRIAEIKKLIEVVTESPDATDTDAWFTLGRIYAVITTSDREIEALTLVERLVT